MIKSIIKRTLTQFRIGSYNPDLFICAYPKSGVTWLCSVIEIILSKGINPIIDIDSGWSRVYDYDRLFISGLFKLPFGSSKNIVIYKSHFSFIKHMNPCIVLARDPRDSITSHYRFLRERGNRFDMRFDDFLLNKTYGLPLWRDFYLSYLNSTEANRVAFVRYEDISSDIYKLKDLLESYFRLKLDLTEDDNIFEYLSMKNRSKREEKANKYDLRISWKGRGNFSSHKIKKPSWNNMHEEHLNRIIPSDLLDHFGYYK